MPAFVIFIIFLIIPIATAIQYSFMSLDFMGNARWAGLNNYRTALTDEATYRALKVTIVFSAVYVLAGIGISVLVVGLFTHLPPRWRAFFRSSLYLPTVIPIVATAVIWKWLFNYSFGFLNAILEWIGLDRVDWLGSPSLALYSIAGMLLATGLGASILILAAAVDAIPQDLIEAASLDGAGVWRTFLAVTLPLVKPALLYLVVIQTVGALQVFAPFALMTGGGPTGSTTTLGYKIYTTAFEEFDFGRACALSVVLTVIIAAVAVLQFRVLASDVEY